MRNNVIVLFIGLIFFLGIETSAQNFSFGVTTGFNISNVKLIEKTDAYKDSKLLQSKFAFNVNAYIGYKSKGFFGFSIEPGYIQKGGAAQAFNYDLILNYNYIQLPILADFYITDHLFFSIGPEIAYMMNAGVRDDGNSYDMSDSYKNKWELSAMIGVNYNIFEKFDVGFRYNHGLTPVLDDVYWTFSKPYNQYYQLIFRLKIQKKDGDS